MLIPDELFMTVANTSYGSAFVGRHVTYTQITMPTDEKKSYGFTEPIGDITCSVAMTKSSSYMSSASSSSYSTSNTWYVCSFVHDKLESNSIHAFYSQVIARVEFDFKSVLF